MIDLPNLIAGFILGLVPTLLLWWADHSKQKRARRQEALDSWRGLAKEIELMLYKAETTGQDIHNAYARHPVDTWRSVLGPTDFRLLEELEQAYGRVEAMGMPLQLFFFDSNGHLPETPEDVQRRLYVAEKREAIVAFVNHSRRMQAESYTEVVNAEQRARVWQDYRAHPFRTWKRERHNRRVRRENPWPDGTPAGN